MLFLRSSPLLRTQNYFYASTTLGPGPRACLLAAAVEGVELPGTPLLRTSVNKRSLLRIWAWPLFLLDDQLSHVKPSDLQLLYVEALDLPALHGEGPDRQSPDCHHACRRGSHRLRP